MPLAERVVEPSILGGQPLNLREKDEGKVHTKVAANSLIGALYQLASVVRHADDIFCDISDECRKVLERTENINRKIEHIQHHVEKLDAKNVQIPIGDLSAFSRLDDHHTAKHGFEINLFTEDSRPHCISDRYHASHPTPAGKLRGADLYRKDGLCTERLFQIWPIVLNEHKVRTPDMNLPRKLQSVFTFEKKYKKLKKRPKTITSLDELYMDKKDKDNETEKPYDVPRFQPPEKVSIDISGKGFQQMESFRQALEHIEREDTKKKKKRKSISGVPEDIMKEIEKFERKRKSMCGHDIKDYVFEDHDENVVPVNRDEEMVKYLDEIDAKIDDRQEEEILMKERKIMKFLPCRRSKSLPRCVRLYKPNEKRQSIVGSINAQEGSCLSLASNGTCASRISRATKRSSIISNKIKILVNGSSSKSPNSEKVRQRPKSLDLDAIDFNEEMTRSNLAQSKMPSMPDGVFNNTTAEMRKNIGPGSFYSTESNTLPRRRNRRSESPWEYLPKDWTSSVKLREINKGRSRSREDRQSSSGHWSGSNSNRHSLDSDNVKSDYIPHKTSQISLGQDSGRGSPLLEDERGSTESTGGYIGDTGSTVTDGTSIQEGKLDTDSWIKSLAVRALGRDEVSNSSAETLNSLTKLTKQNIEALDLMMSPSRREHKLTLEDDQFSEYSVDQEGFYTSFHNDSGLRKSSATLVDEDDLSHSKDSHSVCSFDSVIHNPDSDKYAAIKKTQSSKSLSKVTPPMPPKRTSSISSNISSKSKEVPPHVITRQDSLFSDTDQEVFFQRVENKSKISANGIPSMCNLTSDDDSLLGKSDSTSEGPSPDSSKLDVNQNVNKSTINDHSSLSQFSVDKTLKSGSSMDGISVFTINSDQSSFETSNNKTLLKSDKNSDYTNSWPRSSPQKKETTKSTLASILKNSDSSLPHKSLYQCPTLNMFDSLGPTAQDSKEEPKTASKEELEKMGDNSSYMLSIPMADGSQELDVPTKYQPVITVKPGLTKSDSGNRISSSANVRESSFALTGNPKTSNVEKGNDTTHSDFHTTNFSGSLNSINSELSMADSFTVVSRTSNCSSPNLSNMDIPAVLTPTASVDSLAETTKKCSDTIDNSNLSSTMETVAITTNNSVSLNSTNNDSQKSFRTFSGEMLQPSQFVTSTPYSSSAGMQYQNGTSYFQESPVSYHDQQRKMHTSQSFPSNMSHEIAKSRTESKRHSLGNKPHPVVNLNQLDDLNDSKNAPQSNSRTDSYRVAMVNPARSGSYRVAMNESASYPSFNNVNRRSTTPRVNVTNQMMANDQTPNQQSTNYGSQGQMSSGGKGRYNPLYAATKDVVKPRDKPSHSHNRRSLDSQLPPPQLHHQKMPSPSTGRHQNQHTNVSVVPQMSRLNQSDPGRSEKKALNGHSTSLPSGPESHRTDSYRVALGSYDGPGRNSSYRVAVKDTDPLIPDNRLDVMDQIMTGGRDTRRMGITNIDQAKRTLADENKDSKTQVVRRRKPDVDPISVLSNRETNTSKTNKNRFSTSSTFIQFDPISEDWEFMMNSSDTMSNFSAGSDRELIDHGDIVSRDTSKLNIMTGARGNTEKASSSSLLGSIKSTLKSMSGKQSKENFEEGRYSMV